MAGFLVRHHTFVLPAACKAVGDWSPNVSTTIEIPGYNFVACKNIDFDSNQLILSAWGMVSFLAFLFWKSWWALSLS